LLFFIGISCFIFIFIIPRFAEMFQSLHQELPILTRSMISMSTFVRSKEMVWLTVFFVMAIFIVRYYCLTVGKKVWHKFIMQMPFVGELLWQHQLCQVLQALSLLVDSGVTLVAGLKIVGDSIDNDSVKFLLNELHQEVESGQLLSNAMASSSVFLPEVIALIHVGQESGTLGQSLQLAGLIYSDKLEHSMRQLIFFLQPMVIVLLGLLVSTLIFAVYLPIMQLSHVL
jgi:type II secretory pathway component PulF